METAFLHTFLLTVDVGSMAEAARQLDLSSAAVGQQIRSLERDLGVSLIARAGRTVRPTEAGFRVVERSRVLLRDFGNLKAAANEVTMTGELRVGAINTALDYLFPNVLKKLVGSHPELRVFIQSALSSDLFQSVQCGDLDAAVCLHPQFALPKTCVWETLREEALVLLVPKELAGSDPHQLLETQYFIRYDRRQWGGQQAERYLRKAGITPRERFELSHVSAIAALVGKGLGVALVPDTILPPALYEETVKIQLPIPSEPRRLGVLWLRSSINEKLISVFVEKARLAFGGSGTEVPA